MPHFHLRKSFGFIKCTDKSFNILNDIIQFYQQRIIEQVLSQDYLIKNNFFECFENGLEVDLEVYNRLKERIRELNYIEWESNMMIDYEKCIRKELRNRL